MRANINIIFIYIETAPKSWKCPKCTLDNVGVAFCDACGYPETPTITEAKDIIEEISDDDSKEPILQIKLPNIPANNPPILPANNPPNIPAINPTNLPANNPTNIPQNNQQQKPPTDIDGDDIKMSQNIENNNNNDDSKDVNIRNNVIKGEMESWKVWGKWAWQCDGCTYNNDWGPLCGLCNKPRHPNSMCYFLPALYVLYVCNDTLDIGEHKTIQCDVCFAVLTSKGKKDTGPECQYCRSKKRYWDFRVWAAKQKCCSTCGAATNWCKRCWNCGAKTPDGGGML